MTHEEKMKKAYQFVESLPYREAVKKYLEEYTQDFSIIGAAGGAAFYLDGEKYVAPKGIVYVGYMHENGKVTVAWGNPDNRFMLYGSEAILLADSTTGKHLICFFKRDDVGDGSHINSVRAIESYGPKYIK